MFGALSRSSTSEPTTVVGVDAEKPGSAAREPVTTISSSSSARIESPSLACLRRLAAPSAA